MQNVNPELISYIQKYVFPQYEKNDGGHSLDHVEYVIRRSFTFAEQFESIDADMLYTAAAFHDIAHHIDKKNHEKLSAEIFFSTREMERFFTAEQRLTVKEAIEDHRASLDGVPRSDYGKIISSADRSTDVDDFLRRTHAYTLKHFPACTQEEAVSRAYTHTFEKYGEMGYAGHYVQDEEYSLFRETVNSLLKDKEKFNERYKEINGI
ncbi:MAG: HD domain-containing protein [Clostridia bacterium]|nr:HD domain-containing protein [Clostridia bacterium]